MSIHHRFKVRSGLSLLEVMIVLIIMVGLTAIVWPNLQIKLQRTSLNESAAMVRELLNETRYRATENGRSYVVRLETGSNELSVGSIDQFLAEPEMRGSLSADTVAGTSLDSRSPTKDALTLKVLPESVVISEVRWSTSSSEPAGNDPASTVSSQESTGYEPIDSESAGLSPSEIEYNESIPVHAYWLPILASVGQGRDVTITLTDTTVHESIDVSFCAATGAVEVSP